MKPLLDTSKPEDLQLLMKTIRQMGQARGQAARREGLPEGVTPDHLIQQTWVDTWGWVIKAKALSFTFKMCLHGIFREAWLEGYEEPPVSE